MRRCVYCGQTESGIIFPCDDLNGHVWDGPSDQKVGVTIEQLQHLLEVVCANDVRTAKEWLVNAIHQGKKDLRERK
jgi:hypothetical protein